MPLDYTFDTYLLIYPINIIGFFSILITTKNRQHELFFYQETRKFAQKERNMKLKYLKKGSFVPQKSEILCIAIVVDVR